MMQVDIEWKSNTFGSLVVNELYDILHLRSKVFVLEQDAPYLDLDYKDQKALHLCGYIDGGLVAYCRMFRSGDYFDEASIGRVIVASEYRKCGLGNELMKEAIRLVREKFDENIIVISAQAHLKNFYEGHGFEQISEPCLEDGIPHIHMRKS